MSVITTHYITAPNIKQRLIDAGAVHPGELYSSRRKENVYLENLLDYEKCNKDIVKNLKEDYQKNFPDINYTEEDLNQLMFMPVSFIDENTLVYSLNYNFDESPARAIGALFPNEIMKFCSFTEGRIEAHYYFKNQDYCTIDGRKVETYTDRIKSTLIKEKGDKYELRLPLYKDDLFFTTFYINKNDVHSINLQNEYSDKRICITNKNDKVTVYRTKANGLKCTETLSMGEINDLYTESKKRFRLQKEEERNRRYHNEDFDYER